MLSPLSSLPDSADGNVRLICTDANPKHQSPARRRAFRARRIRKALAHMKGFKLNRKLRTVLFMGASSTLRKNTGIRIWLQSRRIDPDREVAYAIGRRALYQKIQERSINLLCDDRRAFSRISLGLAQPLG